ncbi:hypothetical protein BDV35DRAFT_405242 [Aspergillus flavus]|uniref:Uncharacterized protein n=1 Tax=Aspergillus flavus TaxID=5059 RepID=A0A5N6GV75_ASPFL|nr:hypothetical protein BDV35DRAFT_405242 [Aspergillus flavus]
MSPKRRSANAGRATCPSEEDNPASSTTTSNQSWKLKFNDRQLERKRQADRITQRRMREPSKQTAAAFKVDTLVSGVTGLPGVPDPCLTSSGLEAPSGSNQDVPIVEQRSNLCRTFA